MPISKGRPQGGGGKGPRGGMKRRRDGGAGGRFAKKRPRRTLAECDYKDVELLHKFITEKGKILPRKITRFSAKDQRRLTRVIKRSRHAGLLPFQVEI